MQITNSSNDGFSLFEKAESIIKEKQGHFFNNVTLTDDLDLGTKKGLTTKNTRVKHGSSITYHSKVMATSQVFLQADRQMEQLKHCLLTIFQVRKTLTFTLPK